MNSDGFDNSIPDRWNALGQHTQTLLPRRQNVTPPFQPYFTAHLPMSANPMEFDWLNAFRPCIARQ